MKKILFRFFNVVMCAFMLQVSLATNDNIPHEIHVAHKITQKETPSFDEMYPERNFFDILNNLELITMTSQTEAYSECDLIASGEYGNVFKCCRPRTNDCVAKKMALVDKSLSNMEMAIMRVISASGGGEHQLMTIFEAGSLPGNKNINFFTMPLNSTQTLLNESAIWRSMMEKNPVAMGKKMKIIQALMYKSFWEFFDGLAFIHSLGILHGDLHSRNVLSKFDKAQMLSDSLLTCGSDALEYKHTIIDFGNSFLSFRYADEVRKETSSKGQRKFHRYDDFILNDESEYNTFLLLDLHGLGGLFKKVFDNYLMLENILVEILDYANNDELKVMGENFTPITVDEKIGISELIKKLQEPNSELLSIGLKGIFDDPIIQRGRLYNEKLP